MVGFENWEANIYAEEILLCFICYSPLPSHGELSYGLVTDFVSILVMKIKISRLIRRRIDSNRVIADQVCQYVGQGNQNLERFFVSYFVFVTEKRKKKAFPENKCEQCLIFETRNPRPLQTCHWVLHFWGSEVHSMNFSVDVQKNVSFLTFQNNICFSRHQSRYSIFRGWIVLITIRKVRYKVVLILPTFIFFLVCPSIGSLYFLSLSITNVCKMWARLDSINTCLIAIFLSYREINFFPPPLFLRVSVGAKIRA